MPQNRRVPFVEITRTMDESPWHGFLVAESESLVVFHRVSDRFDLDGYCAFRREDIESIAESFEKLDLLQRALGLKQQKPLVPEHLDATSMRSLMESAQAAFGALVIAREEMQTDEVEVGAIRMASEETYVLRWLSTNAEWDNDDRPFRYRDVTKLEFGAEYEQTLLAVARSRESDGVPRVYADFNGIEYPRDGSPVAEIALTGYGTLASLSCQRLQLAEGMRLVLYEPNDIECDGVAHFDRTRTDPAGRLGEWVARVHHKLIRDNVTEKDEPGTHPCSGCGADLNVVLKGRGRSYTEDCPLCGTGVMAPMAPPEGAT